MKTINIYVLIIILFFCNNTFCQNAWLDTSFNHIGLSTYPFYTNNDECHALIIQPDNKIVMAGVSYSDIDNNSPAAITRCNNDGTLDYSFGNNGKTIFQSITHGGDDIRGLALQADGKIIATGIHQDSTNIIKFITIRFNSDGSIDSTFSNDGFDLISFLNINDQSFSVKVQHDGKILVAGFSSGGCGIGAYVAMARYNTDGTMDNSFGNFGKVLFQVNGSCYAKDLMLKYDYIYIAGLSLYSSSSAFLLARFLMNGQIDSTFGTNGTVITPIGTLPSYAYSIDDQSNGKIICSGVYGDYINNDSLLYALVRYNADGSIDNTFGNNGTLITNIGGELTEAFPLAIQADDKIAIGCTSGINYDFDFVVARFLPDGDIDNTFGNNGAIFTDFGKNYNRCWAIAIQSDGKIDAAGMAKTPGIINIYDEMHFALARYLPELQVGIINNLSGNNITYIYPNPILNETTLEYELTNDQDISISLIDLSGKVVKNIFVSQMRKTGKIKEQINLSDILPGNYMLKIYSQSINTSIRLIKK